MTEILIAILLATGPQPAPINPPDLYWPEGCEQDNYSDFCVEQWERNKEN